MNRNLETLNFKEILSNIKAVVFDIDGVLSSSTVNINEIGYLQRTTSVKDGFAIKCAIRKGLVVAIISGRRNITFATRKSCIWATIFPTTRL